MDNRTAYGIEYRAKNREKLNAASREFTKRLKSEILDVYGTSCARCGFDDPRALQIDHINDNGSEHRKELGRRTYSGKDFYCWLKRHNYPEGYQTLCANCNTIKLAEYRDILYKGVDESGMTKVSVLIGRIGPNPICSA